MNTPCFKVISDNDKEDIPVSVAGKIMMDIQSLILHIGSQIIEKYLMLTYDIQKSYLDRFVLHITAVDGKSMTLSTNASDKFSGSIMDDAVGVMTTLMDMAEDRSLPEILSNIFPDPKYRSWIVGDLDALSRDITGYSIQYNSMGASGVFKGAPEEIISKWSYPLPDEHIGTVVGILYADPLGRPRLACDKSDVILSFNGEFDEHHAQSLCGKDLYSVTGNLSYSKIGILDEIHSISSINNMCQISFSKIISETRDASLSVPVNVYISYDPEKKTWHFSNTDLGITTSCTNWDDAMKKFHSEFMDLLNDYDVDSDQKPVHAHIRNLGPSFRK